MWATSGFGWFPGDPSEGVAERGVRLLKKRLGCSCVLGRLAGGGRSSVVRSCGRSGPLDPRTGRRACPPHLGPRGAPRGLAECLLPASGEKRAPSWSQTRR